MLGIFSQIFYIQTVVVAHIQQQGPIGKAFTHHIYWACIPKETLLNTLYSNLSTFMLEFVSYSKLFRFVVVVELQIKKRKKKKEKGI